MSCDRRGKPITLDKADLPKRAAKSAEVSGEDIPEALRTLPQPFPRTPSRQFSRFWGLTTCAAIALGIGFWLFRLSQQQAQNTPLQDTSSVIGTTALPDANSKTDSTQLRESQNQDLLGHKPYSEAPPETLQPIVSDGSIKLREAAAQAFIEMMEAARRDGVFLVPLSGFRSIADQNYLFFEIKAERGQVAAKRAEVSAPPGYSEHHTGYAIDIGDGTVPATNLSQSFEHTPVFQWLEANASYFQFELSFPRNNPQGVSYEPWHWRFVGNRHSLETFYKEQHTPTPLLPSGR